MNFFFFSVLRYRSCKNCIFELDQSSVPDLRPLLIVHKKKTRNEESFFFFFFFVICVPPGHEKIAKNSHFLERNCIRKATMTNLNWVCLTSSFWKIPQFLGTRRPHLLIIITKKNVSIIALWYSSNHFCVMWHRNNEKFR